MDYEILLFYIYDSYIGNITDGDKLLNTYKDNNATFQILNKDEGLSFIFRFINDNVEVIDIIELNNIFITEGLDFYNL